MDAPPLPSLTDWIAPIRDALDALDRDACLNWMRGLGRGELRALYRLAEHSEPLSLDHFAAEEGRIVVHDGQNSLPAFTVFQKRIVRRNGALQGYNFQKLSPLTGPGHFTLRQDGPEVLFDYTAIAPDVPELFPPLAANDAGMAKLVYGGMIDRVRRVSREAVIGEAWKGGRPAGAWFMLLRAG